MGNSISKYYDDLDDYKDFCEEIGKEYKSDNVYNDEEYIEYENVRYDVKLVDFIKSYRRKKLMDELDEL